LINHYFDENATGSGDEIADVIPVDLFDFYQPEELYEAVGKVLSTLA
jgi:hypothetical protein